MELKKKLIHLIYENDDLFDKIQEDGPDGYWICAIADPYPMWIDKRFHDLLNNRGHAEGIKYNLPALLDTSSFNLLKEFLQDKIKGNSSSETLPLVYQSPHSSIHSECKLVTIKENDAITYIIGLNRIGKTDRKTEGISLKKSCHP
jgi:hypothetical protein